MSKYNMYDNELTLYIKAIVKTPIHDIVGDIAGDILSVDIPSNIPDGDIDIHTNTALGDMMINIARKPSKTVVTFKRQISQSIMEEYTLELDNVPINFLVQGHIIELRENGIIYTNVLREYDYCNHDDADLRLINSEETQSVYTNEQLEKLVPNLCFTSHNLQQKYLMLEKIADYLKNLSDLSRLKNIFPSLRNIIKLSIPGYIWSNYRPGQFPQNHVATVNCEAPIMLYDLIEGNKTLERINNLLHGSINSESIKDLKTILDHTKNGSKNFIYGFNYLANHMVSAPDDGYCDKLCDLEEKLIGPSKIVLSKEYYAYIKELILDAFKVQLDEPINPDNIVYSLKNSYRGDGNESK